jgi:putative acetyltransferase
MKELITIEAADFDDPQLLALLRFHLDDLFSAAPPQDFHALDLSGLKAPDMTLWVAKHDGSLVGMGGLKQLDPAWGEVKSMRTHPDYLRRGIAATLLEHVIAEARRRGYRRLSLETGRGEVFEAALTLYRRHGFRNGEVFADYPADSEFSQFLHLDLN